MRRALKRAGPVAAYSAAISVIFFLNPLGIEGPLVRSLMAAIAGAGLLVIGDRLIGEREGGLIGRVVLGVVICLVFFGDPFGVSNPFPRCLLACGMGFGAAFAAEATAGAAARVRSGSHAALIATTLIAAAAQAQTCPDPPPDADAAWSAGFAMHVGRFCAEWRADLPAMHEARALPGLDPACFETQFAPDSPAARSLREGGEAADEAHAVDPSFCADPARSPPARAQVRAFIAPKP